MSVPFKGIVNKYDDAYNFYVSQLRITIERAFGVLLHRWAILRRPLTCPLRKVSMLVMCLCRLYNYCINEHDVDVARLSNQDAICSVHYIDALQNRVDNCISQNATLVRLMRGRPNVLLHGGNHFVDAPHN